MFSVSRMGPTVSGSGLWDIDRILLRVSKSRPKNWEVLARRNYTDYFGFLVFIIIGKLSSGKEFLIFGDPDSHKTLKTWNLS